MKNSLLHLFIGICFAANGQDSVKIQPHYGRSSLKFQYEFNVTAKNMAGASNLGSIEYGLKLKNCPLIARLNHAAGNGSNALQFEAEAYPSLNKKIYSFLNAGYSNGFPFPVYRAAMSVYFSLPHAYELDGGVRYLYFNDHILIYTGSIGKYYKKFWFNVSGFVTPSANHFLKSWILKTRVYTNDEDYFMFSLGTGVSPDDRSRFILPVFTSTLRSYNLEGQLEQKISKQAVITIRAGWYKTEFQKHAFANQYKMGTGIKWLFKSPVLKDITIKL